MFYSGWRSLLMAGIFFMKVPLYGLHLWLTKLHVESPRRSSVLLASLLLKIGTYGTSRILSRFMRVTLDFLLLLAILGFFLLRLYCFLVSDLKLLVAYSSVVHMNFLLFMMLNSSLLGKSLRLLLGVAHGFISALLFYLVGELYGYFGTRTVYFVRGFWLLAPVVSFLVTLVFLANAGVPPFLGFFGEVASLMLSFIVNPYLSFFTFVYFIGGLYYSLRVSLSVVTGVGAVLKGGYMVILTPLVVVVLVSICFVIL